MELTEVDIQPQMTRRRPGQSAITTPRNEKDRVEINSGTEFGITLGTPIGMRVMNENQTPKDYGNSTMDLYPRPSHAGWTYLEKYGVKASSGGGRSSARETIGMLTRAAGLQKAKMLTTTAGRVAAGAIAEKYLRLAHGIEIVAFVSSAGNEFFFPPTPTHPTSATNPEFLKMIETIDHETVDSFAPVRCPNEEASKRMEKLVADFRDRHDNIGGMVTCVIRNCPSGLGEPCFDTGSGASTRNAGHTGNEGLRDWIRIWGLPNAGIDTQRSLHQSAGRLAVAVRRVHVDARPRLTTKTNNSGGIRGGISNGAPIYFTVGFKPPATIGQAQQTATYGEEDGVLEAKGRHDPCVVPLAVPIVEAR